MTENKDDRKWDRKFWLLLGGITAFRLVMAGQFGLSVDESHYAMYAEKISWGYFDHPPMVGFLGALTTGFAENAFFYRLGPILCWVLSVIILRSLILRMFGNRREVFWALILLVAMPVQNLLGIALLPDAPLNLFWCATLLFAWIAVTENRWRDWILVGLFFGCALLSKYHAVLLPACLAGYVLTSRRNRGLVLSPRPYIAGLVGAIVFLPNVIWNYRHDWISYAYQLKHGGGDSEFEFEKVAEVLGGQLGAVSPVLFVLMIVAWTGIIRRRGPGEAERFMLWTSLPVFVFFCGIGFAGDTLPHWPGVGLWTGAVCLYHFFSLKFSGEAKSPRRWKRWLIGGEVTGLAIVALMYAAISYPLISFAYVKARQVSLDLNRKFDWVKPLDEFESKYDPTNDMYGWEEAARRVERVRSEMPRPDKTFVFAHRFYSASQIGVYLDDNTRLTSLSSRGNQYRLWFDADMHEGWDALFVDHDRYFRGPEKYSDLFRKIDQQPVIIRITRDGQVSHVFRVYKCYDFAGRYK